MLEFVDDAETEVVYMTVEGMLKVYARLGIPADSLCTYCIGGPYPYAKVGIEDAAATPAGEPQPVA